MRPPKNYSSAVRDNVRSWCERAGKADLLIGIPAYNSEMTIGKVVSMIGQGLKQFYGALRSVVIVSDGGSLDDTREEAFKAPLPDGIERQVFIYRGLAGKGTSLRSIFEIAEMLEVRACGVFDSDLRSITPEWIHSLIEPVLTGKAEFVVPLYERHKFDGTITNQLVYPMTRALYGLQVRQPIGGDFGFSRRVAAFLADQDVWLTDVAHFGIDLWMTTTAINEGFAVVQSDLGVKLHNPKDPAADLSTMFCNVISTLFYLMGKYEHRWRSVTGSSPVETFSKIRAIGTPDPLTVNYQKMKDEFVDGFDQFHPLYKQILHPDNHEELERCVQSTAGKALCAFPDALWTKIAYDFAYTYQTWRRNRRRLVDLLVPLYFGRTAAYCWEVEGMSHAAAEDVIERQAVLFEELKPYLIHRFRIWEE